MYMSVKYFESGLWLPRSKRSSQSWKDYRYMRCTTWPFPRVVPRDNFYTLYHVTIIYTRCTTWPSFLRVVPRDNFYTLFHVTIISTRCTTWPSFPRIVPRDHHFNALYHVNTSTHCTTTQVSRDPYSWKNRIRNDLGSYDVICGLCCRLIVPRDHFYALYHVTRCVVSEEPPFWKWAVTKWFSCL
jgi:hypothetical protein